MIDRSKFFKSATALAGVYCIYIGGGLISDFRGYMHKLSEYENNIRFNVGGKDFEDALTSVDGKPVVYVYGDDKMYISDNHGLDEGEVKCEDKFYKKKGPFYSSSQCKLNKSEGKEEEISAISMKDVDWAIHGARKYFSSYDKIYEMVMLHEYMHAQLDKSDRAVVFKLYVEALANLALEDDLKKVEGLEVHADLGAAIADHMLNGNWEMLDSLMAWRGAYKRDRSHFSVDSLAEFKVMVGNGEVEIPKGEFSYREILDIANNEAIDFICNMPKYRRDCAGSAKLWGMW